MGFYISKRYFFNPLIDFILSYKNPIENWENKQNTEYNF